MEHEWCFYIYIYHHFIILSFYLSTFIKVNNNKNTTGMRNWCVLQQYYLRFLREQGIRLRMTIHLFSFQNILSCRFGAETENKQFLNIADRFSFSVVYKVSAQPAHCVNVVSCQKTLVLTDRWVWCWGSMPSTVPRAADRRRRPGWQCVRRGAPSGPASSAAGAHSGAALRVGRSARLPDSGRHRRPPLPRRGPDSGPVSGRLCHRHHVPALCQRRPLAAPGQSPFGPGRGVILVRPGVGRKQRGADCKQRMHWEKWLI